MANAITNTTVCRAISGLVTKQNGASFAQVGGDYRAHQNSTSGMHKIINWLAQFFDRNYHDRTLSEVNYKTNALQRDFVFVAEEILNAKTAADGTVHIEF